MAERKSFLLRLPADLFDDLQRWARDDLRSLNAQIEYLLRDAAKRRGRSPRSNAPNPNTSDNGIEDIGPDAASA